MTRNILVGLLLTGAVLAPTCAIAQEQAPAASLATPAEAASPFGSVKPVDNADLNAVTGRSDLAQVVNAQNKGVVSGNTISGPSQTGTIHFDSSSFQNLNGLSLLSANTGNNVAINSSLNVNVSISNR